MNDVDSPLDSLYLLDRANCFLEEMKEEGFSPKTSLKAIKAMETCIARLQADFGHRHIDVSFYNVVELHGMVISDYEQENVNWFFAQLWS